MANAVLRSTGSIINASPRLRASHPTVRFDTWKEKRFLLIIPAYEKARMIRKRISNHSDF
ncbi:hypothetical protein [Ligilactobacillus ruminis]|uniref:hypothetical protein n=1 Tax=Ligilactobacillus ruminis TaxID=1623 RepID=UPI0022E8F044|nr:hypothetical protein [Ligilactobacillus ruminis]